MSDPTHKADAATRLAQQLGNIAEACRWSGMDRSGCYQYKRGFQTHGLEGLKDLPPIPPSHSQITPPEVVERILTLAVDRSEELLTTAVS